MRLRTPRSMPALVPSAPREAAPEASQGTSPESAPESAPERSRAREPRSAKKLYAFFAALAILFVLMLVRVAAP
jgi:hypothetical protein